ncbi:hypothetical protein M0804_007223 [Polistes exclamans]|nr:hypothetical protein M0804_007223 [Polistes exclamans]
MNVSIGGGDGDGAGEGYNSSSNSSSSSSSINGGSSGGKKTLQNPLMALGRTEREYNTQANAETKLERLGGGGCADASHKHGRLIARSPSPTPCSHTSPYNRSCIFALPLDDDMLHGYARIPYTCPLMRK